MDDVEVTAIPGGISYGSSIADFCKRNRFSRGFVYAEIKRGALRAVKWKGRTFILDEDATAFFRSLPPLGKERADARAAA